LISEGKISFVMQSTHSLIHFKDCELNEKGQSRNKGEKVHLKEENKNIGKEKVERIVR